jgi:hypothetical protein
MKTINNTLEIANINRDKDDFDIDNIEIKSEIKYCNTDMNVKRYKRKIHSTAWEIRNDKAELQLMKLTNINYQFYNFNYA